MIIGIDHVVILVHDLAAARKDYTALGFTVLPGGEHADGATHNALIVFGDGTYIELLAFRREAPEHWWWRHVAIGEGLIDWALQPDAIEQDIATARRHGVEIDGPISGGRVRPDGQHIAWQMGFPAAADLPFLCGDVTPRTLRVPEGPPRTHANGVTGIARITIAVYDIAASLQRYRALIRPEMQSSSGRILASPPAGVLVPEPGARTAIFPAGNALITLAQPAIDGNVRTLGEAAAAMLQDHSSPLGEYLTTRGEGPCALTLTCQDISKAGYCSPALTHGVALQLMAG